MLVTLEFDVPTIVLQSVGRAIAKLTVEVTEDDVRDYLLGLISNHLRDIATREIARTMSTEEVRRRVYHACKQVRHAGPVPLYGATDKELIDLLPEIVAPRLRWQRYWLGQNGYLASDSERESGKIWKVTEKRVPKWLEEVPEMFLEGITEYDRIGVTDVSENDS